jgi:hypothetical protein
MSERCVIHELNVHWQVNTFSQVCAYGTAVVVEKIEGNTAAQG